MKADKIVQIARYLSKAWTRYVNLFGEPPHGSMPQMAALLELAHTEKWSMPPCKGRGCSGKNCDA